MMSKVVVTEFDKDVEQSLHKTLKHVKIDDLNTKERPVVIKVGVFTPTSGQYTTVDVIEDLVNSFDKAPKIYIAESDSYGGAASEKLQIWQKVYNERVVPFSLSTDRNTRTAKITDEEVAFSNIIFKPNVFISTHVPRRYQDAGSHDMANIGSILKNLLGLIPDRKKHRFHERLPTALLDMYEAIGGIDLAVLDGTYTHLGVKKKRNRIETNMLVIGRDAISVEAVGAYILGSDPMEMPVIKEAMNRGLGEGDINKIEILGREVENLRQKIIRSFRELFPKRIQEEHGWI